jgi:hypothetical protein
MNINRDWESLETKFGWVCVFLIATPGKLFALVFDPFPFRWDNLIIESAVYSFKDLS